jgi:transcriptional regulator with XRE-family HTH domain
MDCAWTRQVLCVDFWYRINQPLLVPKLSGLINDRERAICARVLEVRRAKGWSQSQFAHALEITVNKVAFIEQARTPLRFETGDLLCRIVNLSQRWLAEGKDPRDNYVFLRKQLRERIPPHLLFSQAYDHFLKRLMDDYFSEWEKVRDRASTISEIDELRELVRPWVGEVGPQDAFDVVVGWVAEAIQMTPDHLLQDLGSAIGGAIRTFKQKHRAEIAEHEKKEKELRAQKKTLLTHVSVFGNKSSVKSQMPSLLRRLNAATSDRGAKSQLAIAMGVPLANVSQWLSGEREPGGENTLRLLNWVQAAEATQQKRPGAVISSTRPKTRKTSHENKPKSSPP